MKKPRLNSDSRWDKLVRQAQADAGPPANLSALLRAVRAATEETRPGWITEFASLFNVRRVLPACVTGTVAIALVTTWEAWNVWQALPWAQLISTGGGTP
jgi:hypothetical protein